MKMFESNTSTIPHYYRVSIDDESTVLMDALDATPRALSESGKRDQIQIVAINDLGDQKPIAIKNKYDTSNGRLMKK